MAEFHESVKEFKARYEEAHAKFPQLPSLDALDAEFDILDLVGRERGFPRNVIRYTRWHTMRSISAWGGYLHEFILPNQQSAVSMEEYNYFDEKEKEHIIEILNWIMYRNRQTSTLQLQEDDAASVAFIIELWDDWKKYKPQLHKIMEKNARIWKEKVANNTSHL